MSDSSSIRAAPHCASGGRSLPSAAPRKNGHGGVAERLKAHAWRACIRATVSRVRIPLPPPPELLILREFLVSARQPKYAGVSGALRWWIGRLGPQRRLSDVRSRPNAASVSVRDCYNTV